MYRLFHSGRKNAGSPAKGQRVNANRMVPLHGVANRAGVHSRRQAVHRLSYIRGYVGFPASIWPLELSVAALSGQGRKIILQAKDTKQAFPQAGKGL
ncbi:MAG: hypothetical protein ACK4K8_07390 [Pannonibacter sp.]